MTREATHPYDTHAARATTPDPAAPSRPAATAPRTGTVAHAPEHAA
ncbi:hypothetical protein [Streptomyces sp. NPDC017993]